MIASCSQWITPVDKGSDERVDPPDKNDASGDGEQGAAGFAGFQPIQRQRSKGVTVRCVRADTALNDVQPPRHGLLDPLLILRRKSKALPTVMNAPDTVSDAPTGRRTL